MYVDTVLNGLERVEKLGEEWLTKRRERRIIEKL